jgi:hypothetical protein
MLLLTTRFLKPEESSGAGSGVQDNKPNKDESEEDIKSTPTVASPAVEGEDDPLDHDVYLLSLGESRGMVHMLYLHID